MRGYHSLSKLTELIRKNTEDPEILSGLDNLEKTLKGTNDSNDANWSRTGFSCDPNVHSAMTRYEFLFLRTSERQPHCKI